MRPKNSAVHVLTGTARGRNAKHQESTAKPLDAVPEPPEWLQGVDARRHWFDVLAVLVARRVVSVTDLGAFAVLCQTWGRIVEHAKAGTPFRGPIVSKFMALCAEFGLTPASRGKIQSLAAPVHANRFARHKTAAPDPVSGECI